MLFICWSPLCFFFCLFQKVHPCYLKEHLENHSTGLWQRKMQCQIPFKSVIFLWIFHGSQSKLKTWLLPFMQWSMPHALHFFFSLKEFHSATHSEELSLYTTVYFTYTSSVLTSKPLIFSHSNKQLYFFSKYLHVD